MPRSPRPAPKPTVRQRSASRASHTAPEARRRPPKALVGLRVPPGARVDGKPRRSVTSTNVRYHDKGLLDFLQSWWSVLAGRPLTQWDTVAIALRLAAANPDARLPPEAQELFEAPPSWGEEPSA